MKKEYDFSKMKKRPGKTLVVPDAGKLPVSLRLDYRIISKLKDEAERMGLPYQTLINSILHMYSDGQLIDKKTVELMMKKLKED
jgi:predicted DNA binding CopG/RHH family protein